MQTSWSLFRARSAGFNANRLVRVLRRSRQIGPLLLVRLLPTIRDSPQLVGLRIGLRPASHDTVKHLRLVCSYGDAGLLRSRSAEPLVHPRLRGSVRARFGLRFSARSVAFRIGRGGLVCGRVTALDEGRRVKVTGERISHPCILAFAHLRSAYPRRNSSSILASILPPLMMATLSFVLGS